MISKNCQEASELEFELEIQYAWPTLAALKNTGNKVLQ
jgi:hypothetical protein